MRRPAARTRSFVTAVGYWKSCVSHIQAKAYLVLAHMSFEGMFTKLNYDYALNKHSK